MGLFLTMLACKFNSRKKITDSIIKIMKKRGFILELKEKAKEIYGKPDQFEISNAKDNWIQIFCPEKPDSGFTSSLSIELNSYIFQFHIHDGAFWMYQLFFSGKLLDSYNPIPEYWKIFMSEKEKKMWRGNPSLLSSLFEVPKQKIEPYLIEWDKRRNKNEVAFPEDEFPIINEWSMVDFQKKLGIIYPEFDKPNTLDLLRLKFKKIKSETVNNTKKRSI